MMTAQSNKQKVLYTIVCAAPPATHIQDFIQLAQERNWSTYVIAIPYATRFLDIPLLTTLTGHPIKSDYRHPQEQDSLPKADAIVVVPATFNTINKWAAGITETLAIGILCEAMGIMSLLSLYLTSSSSLLSIQSSQKILLCFENVV
jgi:phosphopantothenoylcysteine decarboxylase